jgi:PST family polysaccharide transporter
MQSSLDRPTSAPDEVNAADKRAAFQQLDRSLATGIAWTAGMRGLTQALQWVAALFVIRLLTPADYGLVAMATAYLGLIRMFSEFGLGAAIVQRQGVSAEQIARLNTVSIMFAIVCAIVSAALSGVLAAFFNEPRLQTIIVVLSITFIFGGVEVVPRALLRKELKFSRIAGMQAADNLSHAAVTLMLAALGYGYWALVLGAVVGTFLRMCVALRMRAHAAAWPPQVRAVRSELLFGWHVVSARMALYLRQFLDVAIVGRLLGTGPLGAYNVAWTQANIPVDRVTTVVSEVTPSIFAAAQTDPAAMRRYFRLITEGIAFLSFPATVGMALLADHFVLVVFGERWAAAIIPLRILAVVGALRSITPILSQVLIATEQARKNMHYTLASAVVIPVLMVLGSRWGLMGVALAWLVGHPLTMLPIQLPQALRAIGMRKRDYLAALLPAAAACVAMAAVVLGVRALLPAAWPMALRFALEVVIGVMIYALGVWFTYRQRLRSLIALFRSARRKSAPQLAAEAV